MIAAVFGPAVIDVGARGLIEPGFARNRSRSGTVTPRVWFEREVLPALRSDIEGQATILGPGGRRATVTATSTAPRGRWSASARSKVRRWTSLPGLRVIARTGIGVDSVDIAAATSRGIAVCNAPDGPTSRRPNTRLR